MTRGTIIRLVEAIEDGDIGYVRDVLLDEIDEPARRLVVVPKRCDVCGIRTSRPEGHIYSLHHPPAELRRAA